MQKHGVDIFATVRNDKNSGEMIEDTQWHGDIFLLLTRAPQGDAMLLMRLHKDGMLTAELMLFFGEFAQIKGRHAPQTDGLKRVPSAT